MRSNEFHGKDSVRYDRFGAQTQQRLGIRIMQVDQNFRAELLEVVEAGDIPIETPSVDITSLQPANPNANSHSHSNTGSSNDIFYYHMNHLGSTAFVTDNNATVTQGFLYAPFGEIISEYQGIAPTAALPKYAFNAKELDEETGMYYYEARYMAPPTFISRDPMFEKYFWMSPYAYCVNNPVKYVDPTGMDFDPVIDEENKTITIKATYYTSKKNEAELQKALNVWNKQSGTYSYVVGKGKNKQKYTINFDLTIADGNFETNTDARNAWQSNTDKKGINYYEGKCFSSEDGDKGGALPSRFSVNPNSVTDLTRTLAHEVGHTLGIGHYNSGLMESGGSSCDISRDYVVEMFDRFCTGPTKQNLGIYSKSDFQRNVHENYWKDRYPKNSTAGTIKSVWR